MAGYNVFSTTSEELKLMPYYRFESVNTQDQLPIGLAPDRSKDGLFHSLGLEFRPIHNIVVKTDYQWNRNQAKTGLDQFNIALGYSF